MRIFLTGGTGYIGSHISTLLIEAGHEVVLFDNLCNSKPSVVDSLELITGHAITFIKGDVRDSTFLFETLKAQNIDAVIHLAGLKAVSESSENPLEYYDNNVTGTLQLLKAMSKAAIKLLVFSSSATVYGDPARVPVSENFKIGATNAYGRTKVMVEEILADLQQADHQWRIACLRYFNPVGAHESGLIGEAPQGTPNNLMPYIVQVASGQREFLNVWGNDYPTPDGTGVRDYIHVCDLAQGHVAALDYLEREGGMLTLNLGTGQGYSVLEVVKAFEKASGRLVPYKIGPRRVGDITECWADPSLAKLLIGWKTSRDLNRMCADAWRWQQHST
jgi:UDP-glucose 4-epimerase